MSLEGYSLCWFCDLQPWQQSPHKGVLSGDVFVFPEGLIHFQFNEGKSNAIALSGLSSKNPSVIIIANMVFGSNPKSYDDVLAKAFQVTRRWWTIIKLNFGGPTTRE
ncbi:hypothetical protein ACSBR2_009305 [Camellia fascicularis]